MMTIVITWPQFLHGEVEAITVLLESGKADRIHIRKPEAREEEVEALVQSIPSHLHDRLVMHDFFEVAQRQHLHGIHLNGRRPQCPSWWRGAVSVSCHSIEELERRKSEGFVRGEVHDASVVSEPFEYLSLSPIYDSISKRGYCSAFTADVIEDAVRRGVIDHRVMALGGVCFANLDATLSMGFGGVMILGDAWRSLIP